MEECHELEGTFLRARKITNAVERKACFAELLSDLDDNAAGWVTGEERSGMISESGT